MRSGAWLVYFDWAHSLFILVFAAAALPTTIHAQVLQIRPDDPRWVFEGDSRPGFLHGRSALLLSAGGARLAFINVLDGSIEFDMLLARNRAFLGVMFRMKPGGEGEDIYFRAHKSGLPDAVQYSPDYRGIAQWQLYHDSNATAAVRLTPGRWQHVRIEFRGSQAAVFVGRSAVPVLVIPWLRLERAPGMIGFWANQPAAGPNDPPAAAIANVVIRANQTTFRFEPLRSIPQAPDVIRTWGVSSPFAYTEDGILQLPHEIAAGEWKPLVAEPDGLVPFDRDLIRPNGSVAVLSGLLLVVQNAQIVRLDLGFSDNATVFLDGRPVFSSRHGFSTNFPRRQGLITFDQATLYLHLDSGSHELVIAVSDTYGGWGLMGRITNRAGVEVFPLKRVENIMTLHDHE